MKESKIESVVCAYARSKGFKTYKFTSPNHRNVPDRIFISPVGLIAFVEFKRPGGVLSAGQLRELRALDEQMCDCYVIDDIEGGKTFVDLMSDPDQYIAAVTEQRRARMEGERRAASLLLPASVSKASH